MKRLLFQLQRWWANHTYQKCRTCDGTGNLILNFYDGCLHVIVCDDCNGRGHI